MAVGAARVGPHGAEGQVEALTAGVPLDGDGAAFGGAVAQHQLTVIIQPHLREHAQVGRHFWRETHSDAQFLQTSHVTQTHKRKAGQTEMNLILISCRQILLIPVLSSSDFLKTVTNSRQMFAIFISLESITKKTNILLDRTLIFTNKIQTEINFSVSLKAEDLRCLTSSLQQLL